MKLYEIQKYDRFSYKSFTTAFEAAESLINHGYSLQLDAWPPNRVSVPALITITALPDEKVDINKKL